LLVAGLRRSHPFWSLRGLEQYAASAVNHLSIRRPYDWQCQHTAETGEEYSLSQSESDQGDIVANRNDLACNGTYDEVAPSHPLDPSKTPVLQKIDEAA
jgi:hypothetical protein